MSQAMVSESACCKTGSTGAACQPMPLAFLRSGDMANVVRVRGKGEVHHHHENLGIVEGSAVSVGSDQAGTIIEPLQGASVALERSVASKIIVA